MEKMTSESTLKYQAVFRRSSGHRSRIEQSRSKDGKPRVILDNKDRLKPLAISKTTEIMVTLSMFNLN